MKRNRQATLFGPVGRVVLAALMNSLILGNVLAADEGVVALPQPKDHSAEPIKRKLAVVPSEKQIDINRAGLEQLKTLPGIGDAEARKIIAGRPYVSKADLVGKKVLPEGLYISIRYRIIAIPADPPKTKK